MDYSKQRKLVYKNFKCREASSGSCDSWRTEFITALGGFQSMSDVGVLGRQRSRRSTSVPESLYHRELRPSFKVMPQGNEKLVVFVVL